jgi:hypothetical protein
VAHRSPPCSFFYKCILQGAIDFAEWRKRSWRRGADAARSIYAYLSKFNRKMLYVKKKRKRLNIEEAIEKIGEDFS